MDEAHQECGSDDWRQAMRNVISPWALGETDLGDDVLEVGPGYCRAPRVSRERARAPEITRRVARRHARSRREAPGY